MSVRAICPSCQTTLRAERVGTIKCPKCQTRFAIALGHDEPPTGEIETSSPIKLAWAGVAAFAIAAGTFVVHDLAKSSTPPQTPASVQAVAVQVPASVPQNADASVPGHVTVAESPTPDVIPLTAVYRPIQSTYPEAVPIETSEPPSSSFAPVPTYDEPREATVYVTRTGAKYHAAGCRHLRSSMIPIKLADAQLHYTACSVCGGGESVRPSAPVQQAYEPPRSVYRDTTPTGKTIYTGPRGGRYHYSKNGNKVYERSR